MTVAAWSVKLGTAWNAGPAETVQVDAAGPSGFAGLASRNADTARGNLPGAVTGHDVADAGVGSIPLFSNSTTASAAFDVWETLTGSWQPGGADVPLIFGDPRGSERTFYGRPDGVSAYDLSMIDQGIFTCVARYRILDPFAYGASTTVSSAGTVTATGTATTERVVVTVHGSGGTPRIENTSTGGWIQWAGTLAGGQTRVLDMRARTVTNGGVSAFSELAAAQNWWGLAPGSNVLTHSGATSIDVTYLPAYA